MQDIVEHRNPFGEIPDWLGSISRTERKAHKDFFGRVYRISDFQKTLKKYGSEKIEQWQNLGLEPHFLPELVMSQEAKFDGWKVKPEDWYYQRVAEGRVMRQQPNGKLVSDKEDFKLEGITALIDTRQKPNYDDGRQMFENDNLLDAIIEKLRQDGRIAEYQHGPQSSRFGVSANEWEEQIKPELATLLGLEVNQVRLERVIEANVIPQLYPGMARRDDGETNTWGCYEEYLGGRADRLLGGRSDSGGLAGVCCYSAGSHWGGRAVRPLVVLD